MKTTEIKEGFTFGLFNSLSEANSFIWGYLFNNSKQYFTPTLESDGSYKLVYEA